MASSTLYEYLDHKPAPDAFLTDVVAGLSAPRKTLAPKYFYDARGSELFEAICVLPEYYPTRTELRILEDVAPDIARRVGTDVAMIEYGSGSATKTPILIRALQPIAYVAIDISGEQLRSAIDQLSAQFAQVRMFAVCADYTRTLPLPQLEDLGIRRRVIYFPGSTIGNLTPDEARTFLVNARLVAERSGAMLVGVDLKKGVDVLNAAYNDAQGVTAAFNRNVLSRINRELGGDFDLQGYRHDAHYNQDAGRIEMHLVSTRDQQVHIDGHTFEFRAGESIHTENSYKYSIEEFQALARSAGFEPEHYWIDSEQLFSIHHLTVPG
jgi:dimethylhistidine N-methyltransferase